MLTFGRRPSWSSLALNPCVDLIWHMQEREDPTLTDWDRFARAEYVRLAMEEEGEFRASDGQNEIWVQQNLEVSAAPPRHCYCSFLCSSFAQLSALKPASLSLCAVQGPF